ncbi:MAG: hypothetical protein FWC89_04540 [Defluviitaleaceae bacterium]|nr:hypothetical protein [Defluviitaleaceae bacterium]
MKKKILAVLMLSLIMGVLPMSVTALQPVPPSARTNAVRLELSASLRAGSNGVVMRGTEFVTPPVRPPYIWNRVYFTVLDFVDGDDYGHDAVRGIHFSIEGGLPNDALTHSTGDWSTPALVLSPAREYRTITVTAALLNNRSVYSTVTITVDPTLIYFGTNISRNAGFREGVHGEVEVGIFTTGLTDGLHRGAIRNLPDGISVDGWEGEEGYIELANGISRVTLLGDNTTIGQNVTPFRAIVELYVDDYVLSDTIEFLIRTMPASMEFTRSAQENFTENMIFASPNEIVVNIAVLRPNGQRIWNAGNIQWTIEGEAEGDKFQHPRGDWRDDQILTLGPSQQPRVITVTATLTRNPTIYTSATFYVVPQALYDMGVDNKFIYLMDKFNLSDKGI